jgi:hypothetical protein
VEQDQTFTRNEVVSGGFEARCTGVDGCAFIWHGDCGLCEDPARGTTTLLHDPLALPPGPWYPTPHGLAELRAGDSRRDGHEIRMT